MNFTILYPFPVYISGFKHRAIVKMEHSICSKNRMNSYSFTTEHSFWTDYMYHVDKNI